ncbi:ERF family protein [Staphylococcus borealis]|uniref:ERF family protein n=1 Tax=Staphylococcus borealis TaxID=2742203 RepID=UPI00069DB6FB|nr:ERF family protein [Staphylococcus borealis]NUI79719.1 ERF family protein [Staphylococcus borealis]NUI80142.1 ERF family protein [Staphylococcus borealis]NUI93515.1 ERF family protein [Staphylococcus borealis]
MNKSESITELNKALANFHKEVKQPMKDANNPFFKSKYVPLENVVEAIDDVAPKFGLTYSQYPVTTDDGKVGISTVLLHESGEFIEYPPATTKPDKNTPQGVGSALTYMRRYSLSAVFGITSDQDDDGNEASGNAKAKQTSNKNVQMASAQTIGTLKKEVIEFTNLIKGTKKEAPQYIVEQKFGINNYNLTENKAVQIINNIQNNAKSITGGNK